MNRKPSIGSSLSVWAVAAVATTAAPMALRAHAQPPPAAPTCKAYGGGKCCAPEVSRHLAVSAIETSCGESAATYLGEKAGKDTCTHFFKTAKEDAFVEVYAPPQKEVPDAPNDPFFSWKKVGKVFVTDKAKSPKSAPMLASATGLWMPGAGFFVSVRASTAVCSKAEATKLARHVK